MSHEFTHRNLNYGVPAPVVFELGTRVRHYGTKMWGTVLETKPQHDGTVEYLVQRDKPLYTGGPNDPTWWASYHIDRADGPVAATA